MPLSSQTGSKDQLLHPSLGQFPNINSHAKLASEFLLRIMSALTLDGASSFIFDKHLSN